MQLILEPRFRNLRFRKLRKVWKNFKPYTSDAQRPMLGAFLCGLGATSMIILRPWPIKVLFDNILIPEYTGVASDSNTEVSLSMLCFALLLISVLWGLFAYGQAYLTARAGHSVVFKLRQSAYAHLQRLSLSFHQRRKTGDLLMRLTGDINLLRDLLVDSLLLGVTSGLMLCGMVTVIFVMDWRLSLVVVAFFPILATTAFRFAHHVRSAARNQRKREGRIAAVIAETLQRVTVIQALGIGRLAEKRFQRTNRAGLRGGLRTTRLEASMNRSIEVLIALGIVSVIWYGVFRVRAGAMTPGDLIVFLSYVQAAFKPIRRLARVSTRLAKSLVCAERLSDILNEVPEVRDLPKARRAKEVQGRIAFENVSFSYREGRRGLKSVNFEVEPGSFLGIVGPSGAGKSTLLALMLRLYDPRRGRIRLDGRALRRYKVQSLRAQMGIVLQEPFLFSGTIRDNIALGRPRATNAEIEYAAESAHAMEFIRGLPDGLDTEVAEGGASLSEGQRQRIAIARAFLSDAPILLLDEPMMSLDAAATQEVSAVLERLREDRTTVMVTHRLADVRHADQILVVQRGKVIEKGTHDQLLLNQGWYTKTWATQRRRERPRLVRAQRNAS